MSYGGLLLGGVRTMTRQEETDTWALSGQVYACRITALSANGARRESVLPEPDVTHVGRVRYGVGIAAGQRIKDVHTGNEYEVRAVREHEYPRPGQCILSLAQVANAIT